MEAKAHANPYPDYSESPLLFIEDGNISKSLLRKTDELVKRFENELIKVLEASSNHGESSIYTGYGGIAMLVMMMGIKQNNVNLIELALSKFQLAITHCKKKRICFLNGDSGVLALSAIVSNLCNDFGATKAFAEGLCKLSSQALNDSNMPDEILYGRAGYLHSLLLANKHLGDKLIPPSTIRTVIEKILQSGRCKSKSTRVCYPLQYEWHDKNYLGAAHGVAGIMYTLLLADKLLTEYELNELIKPTVDWLIKKQRFESGNFASSENNDKDRLVQWCHGAPGFVHLMLKAFEVFNDKKYLEIAKECGDVIWQRGLLTKGYSLCHGVAGNAYSFLQLYKVTKEPMYLHRAACFADWCTHYPRNQSLQPDRPYSLYEGKAGLAYFLMELKDPINSSFPGYDI